MHLMKPRSLMLLALLVVTSALPLLAAAAPCADMPCHRQTGERLMAPMACCTPSIACAPAAPVAQPAATAASGERVAAVVATTVAVETITVPPVTYAADNNTSPPAPTRERLAQLATLLI